MRLLELILPKGFRGLPKDSKFNFAKGELNKDIIEPICLVGLNGSGKSNLLECLAEIFYYLEKYILQEGKPEKEFKTGFEFEISYTLDLTFQGARRLNFEQLKVSFQDVKNTQVRIRKKEGHLPTITLSANDKEIISESSAHDIFILPVHIIAYSSGHNELISNPFIKIDHYYFDMLAAKLREEDGSDIPLNRMFLMDYDSSQIVAVCNYLFPDLNQVSLLSTMAKIGDLDSFSIRIRLRDSYNQPVIIGGQLKRIIEKLKSCATVSEIITGNSNQHEIRLGFKIDNHGAVRKAFKDKFKTSILLYRDLSLLRLLNIHNHRSDTRTKIKNSGLNDNLASLIPRPANDRIIFQIEDVLFKKESHSPIKYKDLSDGEHQMLHILGSIMLLNLPGSMLLFDEPETHFNPDWRSKLISLINNVSKEATESGEIKIRQQEIILTSHSPFIVSDCRKEKVFIFDKGKADNPKINTFGTSVNILTEEVFGKSESISQMSLDKIIEIKTGKLDTLEGIIEAKEKARVLGESVEKILLFRELLIREDEINSNDKKL